MRDYGLKTNLLIDNKINTKELKQFDEGNKITIQVYEAEVMSEDRVIELLSSDTITAIYERPDGMVIDRSCTVEDGKIVTYTDKQILALSGQLKMECVIKRGSSETTTHTIVFNVVESLNRNESVEEDPNYRSDLVSDLLTIKADYITRITSVESKVSNLSTTHTTDVTNINNKVNTNTTNINSLKSSKVDNVTYNTTSGILDFKGNNNSLVTVDLPIPELQQDVTTLYKNNVVVSSFTQLKTALANKVSNCSKILIKAGTYAPTEPLEIPAYTHIAPFGNGKVTFNCNNSSVNNIFRNKLSGTETEYNGAGNITIEGITFNGVDTTAQMSPLAFAHARNIKVIGCSFKNFNNWHNIELNGCADCYIEYNDFSNYGNTNSTNATEVIQLDYCGGNGQYPWTCKYDNTHCQNITIRYNKFENIIGVCVGNHTFMNNGFHNNIRVENNIFNKCNHCSYLGNTNKLYFEGNDCEDCIFGVEVKEGSGQGTYGLFAKDNIFKGLKGKTGYTIHSSENRFFRCEFLSEDNMQLQSQIKISGNVISNCNTHAIGLSANYVDISNNTITDCGKIGIFAYSVQQGNICNNTVSGCGSYGTTYRNYDIAVGGYVGDRNCWRVIVGLNSANSIVGLRGCPNNCYAIGNTVNCTNEDGGAMTQK